jgi:hypothetical protein
LSSTFTCLGAVDAACVAGGVSDCFFGLCGPPEPGCCWSLGESEGPTRTIIAILVAFGYRIASNVSSRTIIPVAFEVKRGKLVNLSLESPFVSLNRVNLPSVFNPSARHTIVSRCRGRSSAHNRTVSEFFLLRLIPRDFFTASHVLLRYYGNASVIPIMPFNLF